MFSNFEDFIEQNAQRPSSALRLWLRKECGYIGDSDINVKILGDFIYQTESQEAARAVLPRLEDRTYATLIHQALDDPKDHPFTPHHHHVVGGKIKLNEPLKYLIPIIWNFKHSGFFCKFGHLLNREGRALYCGMELSQEDIYKHSDAIFGHDNIRYLYRNLYGSKYFLNTNSDTINQFRTSSPFSSGYVDGEFICLDKNGVNRYHTATKTLIMSSTSGEIRVTDPTSLVNADPYFKMAIKEKLEWR